MKYIIFVTSCLCTLTLACSGQDTYLKSINLFGQDYTTAKVLKANGMEFYLSSQTLCIGESQDSFTCMAMSKHDASGNTLWENQYHWTLAANDRSVLIKNDSIFVSGHTLPRYSSQVYNLLVLNTDGDSLMRKSFYYATDTLNGVFNNGLVIDGSVAYLYGQTSTVDDLVSRCVIQKYNYQTDEDTLIMILPEQGEYFPGWDGAIDSEGNLLLLNELDQLPNSNGTIREILKVSPEGKVLDRLYGPDTDRTSDISNQFLLLPNSNYFFLHHIFSLGAGGSAAPQLICMDTSGTIVWSYDFPQYWLDDNEGVYKIQETTLAANGDIVLVGYRMRRKNLGTGNDIFLMRVSQDGDILWQHNYSTKEANAVDEYHKYFPSDVQELADGSLLVAASARHHDQIVLLRTDANGCLEGFNCDDDILLNDNTVLVPANTELSDFVPNPTFSSATIDLDKPINGSYSIFNQKGVQIGSYPLSQQTSLTVDLSAYAAGMYTVMIKSESGYFSKRLFKH